MHTVPEFMRQCHHVARLALVIEQQIRVRTRYRRVGKGARRLARRCRRINPRIVKKLPADISQLWRKGVIGGDHQFDRLGPWNGTVIILR